MKFAEQTMGNTNLPQAGAAGTRNSRDTLSGDEQLSEQQRKRADERDPADVGPSPSRPKNAPDRIPGQQRDAEDAGEEDAHDANRARRQNVEHLVQDEARHPDDLREGDDAAALVGHVDSGHSSPKAS